MEKQQIVKIIEFLSTCFTMPFLYAVKYYFYKNFLGFKYKNLKFMLSLLILVLADLFSMRIQPVALNEIVNHIIWLCAIFFLCNGSFLIKFFAFIILDNVLLLINVAFLPFDFFIIPFTHSIKMTFSQHMIVSFTNNSIMDLLCYFILFIFLKSICNLLDFEKNKLNLYEKLYLIVPNLAIYGLSYVFYIIQKIKVDNKTYYLPYIFPKIYYFIFPIVCSLLISILISVYTFRKMILSKEEHEKSILIEQQLNLQLSHCENIEKLYSGIRSIMHDMNNHISCLKNLADKNNNDEIKKYLHNLSDTVSKLDFKIKTGNPVSDAIVNEKYSICQNNKIEFVCDFILPKKISLNAVDLCIILSNALDNAIEACMRIQDNIISKEIHLKSLIKNSYLIIEISNSNIDKIEYDHNKIISKKWDKFNHGIGIYNIENSVKKYNGVFDIVEGKNKFTMNIMLKVN